MANEHDSLILKKMLILPDQDMPLFFMEHCDAILDDAMYWSTLGALWKQSGSVLEQDIWLPLFRSKRKKRSKIMKSRERKTWNRLPKELTAYRAINNQTEVDTAISWTLCPKVAQKFSLEGHRKVVERQFKKTDIFAYFDRRQESEILVNV